MLFYIIYFINIFWCISKCLFFIFYFEWCNFWGARRWDGKDIFSNIEVFVFMDFLDISNIKVLYFIGRVYNEDSFIGIIELVG